MRNYRRLHPDKNVKMYHVSALDQETKESLNRMWNKLNKYEMELVLYNPTVAKIFKAHMEPGEFFGIDSAKFRDYLGEIEWLYVVEYLGPNTLPAFMAVTKEHKILSLFVDVFFRRMGLGSYLIDNHQEIFNQPVTLQCYKDNHKALDFYQCKAFKSTYTPRKDDSSDLYYTLTRGVNF